MTGTDICAKSATVESAGKANRSKIGSYGFSPT
jgi:hypothetical protein